MPTPEDLAEACRELLPAEDCDDLREMSLDEGLGYALTLLLNYGNGDPEGFLRAKGILE